MNENLRILVVEPNPDRVRDIVDALREAGWSDVKALSQISELNRTVREFAPDIVLIDLANPDRLNISPTRPRRRSGRSRCLWIRQMKT